MPYALRVTVIEEGKSERDYALESFPASIGRGAGNSVVLAGWKVAKNHAEIHQLGNSYKLVDRGSLAGTWVNSERVVEYGPLADTDEIVIGGFRLRVQPSLPSIAQTGHLSSRAANATSTAEATGTATANVSALRAEKPPAAPPVHDTPIDDSDETPTDVARYLSGFEWRRSLHRLLLETIDLRRKDIRQLSDQALRVETEQLMRQILEQRLKLPDSVDAEELIRDVLDEVVGLGALERLLADPSVTEIMVNSADEIFVEREGKIVRCAAAFTSDEAIRSVIDRIVAPLGRRIDESSPMVDARLKDGSRVNAIIAPLSLKGPTITIRKFNKRLFHVEDYVRMRSANAAMFGFLKVCVEFRKNIVIAGGTGSGKTTLLNVLSNLIPRGERIITIEDAAELRLNSPHLVSLEARPINIEGKGLVSIRELVRNSLRMRPDRIVVGECRGGEALDMLQAMNTGHDGSLTTVHANSPRDVISRLEVMTLMAGMDIPVAAIREQIASAIHIIVQQTRASDGTRRIVSITEVTGIENGTVQLQELFAFRQVGFTPEGRILGYYTGCDSVPSFYEQLKRIGVQVDLGIFDRVEPNP